MDEVRLFVVFLGLFLVLVGIGSMGRIEDAIRRRDWFGVMLWLGLCCGLISMFFFTSVSVRILEMSIGVLPVNAVGSVY